MNIVIAIDSFKGSLNSIEAGKAVCEGIARVIPSAHIQISPIADGGEGTVDAFIDGMQAHREIVTVTGPLGEPVQCSYAMLADEKQTAVIEMAAAAGITLVPKGKRNPFHTTTYGVGELIRDAIQKGSRHFIIGIGGSATNDGGVGMLQALGYEFLDAYGNTIVRGAAGLKMLASISAENVLPELKECSFQVACDVTNPLCGETGCSAVFGPQKGADEQMIVDMDHWLENYAELSAAISDKADPKAPGAGAAGGMGFAFLTFLNAVLEPGVQLVLQATGLETLIQKADYVITGEGRLDSQTVMGKAPVGVAALAKKYDKAVIAFCGCVGDGAEACNAHGIDAYFPILRNVGSLEEALDKTNAAKNLSDTAEQVFRMIQKTYSYMQV